MFAQTFHDIRYAARSLRRTPGFTTAALLTLALGIGANAAVYSALKSVLLDTLPYADPGRLVQVYAAPAEASQSRAPLSAATLLAIAEWQSSLQSMAGFVDIPIKAAYGGTDRPQVVHLAWVEPGFFETLGVSPSQGRTLRIEDAANGMVPLSGGQEGADTAFAVVLTHGAWQRLFGTDPGVLGRQVRLNGIARTIVGVLPAGFVGPMGAADFYLAFDRRPVAEHPIFARGSHWVSIVGRIKPGIPHDALQRELAALGETLARQYPKDNGNLVVAAMPLRDALVGDTRAPLLVLMASAALVLLIACANLAGASLSRMLRRRRELAVRAALGAGRGRIVRQLLTETIVLSATGGIAGLVLAVFLLDLLRSLAPDALPAYADVSLDAGAVLVTAALALFTGVAFGVAPAAAAARSDPQRPLREEAPSTSESRGSTQLRGLIVAGQMALCLSLVAGAALLSRSLWAMSTAAVGFNPDDVLMATVELPARDYATPEARAHFLDQFTDRLRALPGVEMAALASAAPTAVRQRVGVTNIDGTPIPPGDARFALTAFVSDEYFRTLQIPIRRGRTFDSRERREGATTVIISESMARQYWPGGEALGGRIRIGPNPNAELIEVVGIVGDVRNDRARPGADPMIYLSIRQITPPAATFLLRTKTDPLSFTRTVERELAALDPALPLQRAAALRTLLGEQLAGRRVPVFLIGAFGGLSLLLAAVGVYAMFASIAAAREREFGIRIALGSTPRAIVGLVLRHGASWMAAGVAAGMLGVVVVAGYVRDFLYEVPPFDPLAIGISIGALAIAATVALLVPIRRATGADPVEALRSQ